MSPRTTIAVPRLAQLALLAIAGFACDEPARPSTGLEALDVAELLSRVETERRPALAELGREETESWRALLEIGYRVEDGHELTDEQWREALLRSGAVGFRERWVASEPFAIWMNEPTWLGNVEVRLTPRDPRLAQAVGGALAPECGLLQLAAESERSRQVLGNLAPGRQRLAFDVEIERGAPRDFSPDFDEYTAPLLPIVWRGELAFEVDVRESLDDVIAPVSGRELDLALRNALRIEGVDLDRTDGQRGAAQGPVAFLVLAVGVEGSPLEDVGVVVDVALEHDGRTEPCGRLRPGGRASLGHSIADLESEATPWTVTVIGASEDLLALGNVERRYSGKVVVAARELIERGRTHANDQR